MNVLAVVLVVALLAFLATRLRERSPKRLERKQIRALRLACKGDQDLVERLLFAELQRSGDISYAEAASRALARLIRDQH
jgi:hypothetical protein